MAKFKANRLDQLLLFPPSVNDYVPEDHLAKLIHSVVEKINTNNIENKYSNNGQNTYHPKVLTKILFYAYATGERSGRTIAKRCETDTAYMYLAQMYKPNFRTINDFRKNHHEELSGYFVDIVRICQELDLVKLGQINIDGTKIKANAAKRMTMDESGYKNWEEKISKKIDDILAEADRIDDEEDKLYGDTRGDELPEAINTTEKLKKKLDEIEKKRKKAKEEGKLNYTDEDAKFMKNGQGKIDIGYNCQAATTNEQIIVGTEVIQEANDRNALKIMIEETERTLGEEVKEVAMDTGYSSYENYEYLNKTEVVGYIPNDEMGQRNKRDNGPYSMDRFTYDKEENKYICPEGKTLKKSKERSKPTKAKKWNHVVYIGTACTDCQKREQCTKQKYRTILRHNSRHLVDEMKERLRSEDGRRKYQKRMITIEPLFGHIKHNLGYRQFMLRGLEKVKSEFRLMCIGSNLKKMRTLGVTVV
ncbi:MAG: IS1182 family transposase [Candidatus Omnitrophica bacterium]|nr:IS1182 family transposase [Candidatus Omnitrophota bacterium]